MLVKKMKYTDFKGNEREEELYFNMPKSELVKMSITNGEDDLEKVLERIIKTNDNVKLYGMFEELVLNAYGEVSEDGRSFKKSQELRDEFAQTAVFSELVTELLLNPEEANAFILGIIPKDLADQIDMAEVEKSVKDKFNVVEE